MCKARTRSLIPDVAKTVKTASVNLPSQNRESYDALRRTTLVCVSSLPTCGHGGNSAVNLPFSRLPQASPARDHHIF
jgi:hypothetical protein